ncbi:BTB/POZ domain-containing protein [Pimephales promelas]|nr:BTB/POZ domain-containing protein [Pimephales promelas]
MLSPEGISVSVISPSPEVTQFSVLVQSPEVAPVSILVQSPMGASVSVPIQSPFVRRPELLKIFFGAGHIKIQPVNLNNDRHAKQPTHEGSIRLVGDLPSSGRVEVYHDGQWGTVCDDGWDMAEAQVVCRQMGFPGAISVKPGGQYGEGSGPIWLDDMNCKGSESSLSECSFKGWGVSDCTHKEDAGVICETGKNITSNRQFSVDNSLGLSDDLGLLFDSGDGCDFNINVQDLSEEGELQFCVHRLILMIYPELNITNESRNLTLDVSQTCHPHVSAFLRYLYTRQIDVSITSAQCLHQLSFIFGVKTLMEDVGRVFTSLLPEDNTFRTQVSMYEYGVRTGDLVLQENVLQYLSWNCEFLINSPLWSTISFHMMDALLQRSDLVVEDEALLLEALERWIQDKSDEISSEQQASLLNHIRFLLIPVDKLYEMQFSSSVLHQNHEKLYLTGLLRGFQFNALPFSKIRNKMDNMSNDYLPRIYTADEWSVCFNDTTNNYSYNRNHYNYGQNNRIQSFSTRAHPSALYKDQRVQWQAQVFLSIQECYNYGVSCTSFPVARFLASGNQNRYTNTIRFNNRLILTCKNQNNVFHVQEFKNDMAVIPNNSSMGLPNPCPDDYSFRFVVRPVYI